MGSFTGTDFLFPEQVKVTTFRDELIDFLSTHEDTDGDGEPDTPRPHPNGADRAYFPAGIIAHSQGGLASALVLESAWTGLDALRLRYEELGNIRLMQSLGSPYQGSGMMDVVPFAFALTSTSPIVLLTRAAAVAIFRALFTRFGRDCEIRHHYSQLEMSAAKALMGDVSKRTRDLIWYQRTYHKPHGFGQWCNWLSSKLVLAGLDDGVVEHYRGKLKDAHAYESFESICHTDGMKYPDQKKVPEVVERLCEASFLRLLEGEDACPDL